MRFTSFLRTAAPAVAAILCLAFSTPTNGELHHSTASPRVLELDIDESLGTSSKRLLQIEHYGWNWVLSNGRGTSPPVSTGFVPASPPIAAYGRWNFPPSESIAADHPGELATEIGFLSGALPNGQAVVSAASLLENDGRRVFNTQDPLAVQEIFILVPEPPSLSMAALMFSFAAVLFCVPRWKGGRSTRR